MASTYSTNLALELMATGDQSGSWGNTTNTNLGTLIEQAISGYVTQAITDGADTTITIPNGASGVARNMYIEMTGALTAARNMIVPSNKKLYFIYNNTTGGYAVTVKVSGQTGVSVPNGKKMVLVSDGTDVVEAINYFSASGSVSDVTASSPLASSGGTTPNISLTGTVNVGNGGTGLTSYAVGDIIYASGTTTLAALADVATGNALISGGVGVAPSWGKIGLTTHVSGTLPVANGGTGQTTYTNGQLLIGNTTGNTLTKATLTAGSGISITNGTGSITIAATAGGGGTVTSVSVVSANGFAGTVATATTTPAITLSTSITGVLKGNGTAISAATAGTDYIAPSGALGTPASGNLSNCTADGTNDVGFRNIPKSGSDKTTTYTLLTTDVGKFIGVGSGGSITIPNSTFAAGDVVSLFNNTSGDITITCSITTAYIGGVNTDRATMTLATRGVATILFVSGTVCVVNGNVS